MKAFLSFLLVSTYYTISIFAQCKGSDSFEIDNFIEAQKNTERILMENRNKKVEKSHSLENLAISSSRNESVLSTNWAIGFSEGLAKIVVKGKSGFINLEGKIVIPPQYKWVSCFSNGLAAVEIKGKWGYINSKNRLMIPAKFDVVDNFSEGLALVKIGKLWGYINKSGRFVIPPKFEEASSFNEGTAVIGYYDKNYIWTSHQRPNGKWVRRFIDKKGNWFINQDFDGIARNFEGGLAIVSRNLGYSEKFQGVISQTFIIDKNAKELWKWDSNLEWFSEDLIVVTASYNQETKKEKYSFLNKEGKKVTEKVYDNLNQFSEGLAVATINEKEGFIDKTGEFVIEPTFFSAGSFSEGLAPVWKNDESGFIDKQGNWKIKLKFDNTEGFRDGRAAIETYNGKIGYIDKSGNYIWKPTK